MFARAPEPVLDYLSGNLCSQRARRALEETADQQRSALRVKCEIASKLGYHDRYAAHHFLAPTASV